MSSANLMETETSSDNVTIDKETTNAVKWLDLVPDRRLLDSNFEGFKLSLDPFVHYKLDLKDDQQLDTQNFIENDSNRQKFFLYQHLKLFGLQNLLIVNNFDDSNLYYFDQKLRLQKLVYKKPKILPVRAVVLTNFSLENIDPEIERANITMKFVNSNTAVIFDGKNTVYICQIDQTKKTEDPFVQEKWNIAFKFTYDNIDKAVIKDAVLVEDQLDILLMSVQESKEPESKLETIITWLMFKKTNDTWSFKRSRGLNCFNSVPEYLALETSGQSIFITGPGSIKFIYDSEKVVSLSKVESKPKKMVIDEELDTIEKFYSWNQSNEEINLNLVLNFETVSKSDLKVELKYDSILVKVKDQVLINGGLSSTVKVDESVWTLGSNNNKHLIEFVLCKAKSGEVWTSFLKDKDIYGEYKAEKIGFLDDMKSENLAKENESKTLFTLEQQLEECDANMDEPTADENNDEKFLMLRRLDGDTHLETHKSYVNDNKFLFDVRVNATKSPALCLRHDVDGVLWQPHRVSQPDTVWLTHEHTFLAFGYIQASKQETKFRSCSPDFSYVCISDTNKHLYLYKQDSKIADTQLKNRKTGKIIKNVAKQYLVSLENDSEIYGVYCSNEFLVVLLKENCYFYQINQYLNEKFD